MASALGTGAHDGRKLLLMRRRISSALDPRTSSMPRFTAASRSCICFGGDNVRVGAHQLVQTIDPELLTEHVDRISAEEVEAEATSTRLVPELLQTAQPRKTVRPRQRSRPCRRRRKARRLAVARTAPAAAIAPTLLFNRSSSGCPLTMNRARGLSANREKATAPRAASRFVRFLPSAGEGLLCRCLRCHDQ